MQGFTSPRGLVSFIPSDELIKQRDDAILADRPAAEPLTHLAQHVHAVFQRNKRGKQHIEQKALAHMRRLNGEYDPDKLAAIKLAKMPVFFMRLSAQKCYDAEVQLVNRLAQLDRFAEIEATPLPDIPEQIMQVIRQTVLEKAIRELTTQIQQTGVVPTPDQIVPMIQQRMQDTEDEVKRAAEEEAAKRATAMQTKIEDQLTEADYRGVLKEICKDIGPNKAVVVKGPIFRREKTLVFDTDQITGDWKVGVREVIKPTFQRVNPGNWFPQVDASKFGVGDNVEIESISRETLADMRGTPGYKDDVIEKVLNDYPSGWRVTEWNDYDRFSLEKQTDTATPLESTAYDCMNYWGSVPGKILLDWGMMPQDIPDPIKSYQVNCKAIGPHVIKAVLNPDPLGRQPYQGTAFRKSNDSVWGQCVVDLMEDIEDGSNAALRPLLKNMAMAATPLTEVDVRKLDTASGETGEIWSGKVIRVYDVDQNGQPAVHVYNIPMNAEPLMAIYEKFKREADDFVTPAIWNVDAGMAKTAAGQSMQRSDAAQNIALCWDNIYTDIIVPCVQKMHTFNMMFLDDPSIKGDSQVKVRNISQLMAKEQLSIRRREILNETNNPNDLAIMEKSGRAYLLSETFKAAEIDVKKAIPHYEQIEGETDIMAMNPAMSGPRMSPSQAGQVQQSAQLDAAGNPVSGQDTATFQGQKQ